MRLERSLVLALAGMAFSVACSKDEPPAEAPISFKDEVAPLLATSCALASCHSSKESNLNFYITYEPKQMFEELMKTSPTCASAKFVVPGKPEESMVMLKMDNLQDKLPENCGSARRSEMPPGDPPKSGSSLLPREDRDLVRAWIAQGAKNN